MLTRLLEATSMLRIVFSSALILTLISCPLRCSVGLHVFNLLGNGTADGSATDGCASCCSRPDSQPSTPADESHSDSGCFCVCGGAILLNHSNLQWTVEQTDLQHALSNKNLPTENHCPALTPQCDKPLEDDGRAIQTRLMSFLC